MMEEQVEGESPWLNGSGYNYISFAQGNSMSPISFVHFDVTEDRFWTGNDAGRIVSYHSVAAHRHTAFVVPGPIRSIETTDSCVLALTPSYLKAATKSGLHMYLYQPDRITNMSCMHQPMDALNTLYLGGELNLVHLDLDSSREIRVVKVTQREISCIRSNGKSVLTSDPDGGIAVRDIHSLEPQRTISCHGGPIIDFDVCGNQLITCGASIRAGSLHGDPYVKVYDLRTYRTLPPIPLSFSPMFTRFLPSYTNGKILLVSQMCQAQLHDLNDGTGLPLLIDTGGVPLSAFAFSPSRQVLAFGDSLGNTHLYSDRDDAVLNDSASPSEFSDPIETLPVSFSIDDVNHSLASIPLPFSLDDGYLSDWPEELCEYAYRKPRPLVEHASLRTSQHVQYAVNPRSGTPLARLNICPYELNNDRELVDDDSDDNGGKQSVMVPRFYRPCIWKQTHKSGDELTSLVRYNRSNRVSIEYNEGANFANPLMQILYHIPAIRNIFLLHLCYCEHCVPCEMAFLFRMLSDRDTLQPASSDNLMRSLRGSSFPGLIGGRTSADKAQLLLHFIFDNIHKYISSSSLSNLSSLINYSLTTNSRCIRCSSVSSQATEMPVFKISYPPGEPKLSFCTLLEKSLNARRSTQAECKECTTVTRIEETLRVRALPPLLLIDANPTATNYSKFWEYQTTVHEKRPRYANPPSGEKEKEKRLCKWGDDCRNRSSCKYIHGSADWEAECIQWMDEGAGTWSHYVPPRFYARISGGIAALQSHEPDSNDSTESCAYDLVAIMCVIAEDPTHPVWKYVVAECLEEWQTDDNEDMESKKMWLNMNGIAITRVSQDEALHLDHSWKLPLIFVYVKRKSDVMTVSESRHEVRSDVFDKDVCLTGNYDLVKARRLLSIPQKGDIVGIDAEFISISKDHTKKSVGRVSVVDSTGTQVIMDDYIVGIEQDVIHDYLTPYSGIVEPDLCPFRSQKHLTTLKASYIKLLHLIDKGVIFVGHALFNDFSMINIHVPANQVRDTVQLFRLPQQRLISLQFLAYHLLDMKIQEKSHDSVEDARVSLHLYRKWEELTAAGTLDATVRWLYEQGKLSNWRMSSPSLELDLIPKDSTPSTPLKGHTPMKETSPSNTSSSQ